MLMHESSSDYARKECTIHKLMDHDNIVKLHDYTENEKEFVMYMEFCNDSDYFNDKINEVSPRSLETAD